MRTGTTAIECYRIGPHWYRPVDSASGQSRPGGAALVGAAPGGFLGLGDEYWGPAGEIFLRLSRPVEHCIFRTYFRGAVAKSRPGGPAHAAEPAAGNNATSAHSDWQHPLARRHGARPPTAVAGRPRPPAPGPPGCPLADATMARRSRNLGEVFAEPQRILIG